MNILKGSLFLKLSALVVAILAYAYIHNELYKSDRTRQDPSYKLIKLTAKRVPIRLRLASDAPQGYRVLQDRATVNPETLVVIGPEALLDETETAETAMVDVSENTKTVVKKVPLESVAGIHLVGESYWAEVTVPIEKVPAPKETQETAKTAP